MGKLSSRIDRVARSFGGLRCPACETLDRMVLVATRQSLPDLMRRRAALMSECICGQAVRRALHRVVIILPDFGSAKSKKDAAAPAPTTQQLAVPK